MAAEQRDAASESRVAVVTGGGSGIGRATAARLVAEGIRVAVLDIGDVTAGDAKLVLRADVTDPYSVQSAFTQIVDTFGRIDVLVNNAGITGSAEATVCHQTPIEEWDRVQAVNVRGPFLCTRAALPTMLAQGTGHVITVASVAGLIAFPGRCAYTASKGAAVMFTRSVAVDYASSGIRANAVCPGMVETPMTKWRLDQPELRAQVESKIPMGRVAQPDEIADAIALLASDRLAYLTGHTLVLDGGWSAL
ncbi:NAD(P)-dependent dehydrogenase (short-subunit alcohol dehydrogenase family) [Kribbella orskensis]|uniref:NAD(P)-dependent dehydrogenase (Short-subunit alcohol dehydrogenase family) n=1 Tax=Kribbella orskensis TaxID=2512216 RepID=A0ABY2BG95_9ACTN|nr:MULTISPECIES: SDR family oxidoreductase [Kribbella]TCN37928.1 NAD(P)-dependent dehydrogenase (short-subunit alcohol dehydrogenase family) [Kribbella sp. VKM Ac-2500]TCO19414.1 NAD(P)-dependent dehydrogenase (short-subunit alcohol dehydrogenase family) [Kribbella orskensis]